MKHIKPLWPPVPKLLRSLLIATLAIVLTGVAAWGAQRETSRSSILEPSDPQLIAQVRTGIYSVPSSCSVPIIPGVVTQKEVELREYQTTFAKFIEERAKEDQQANRTSIRDVLAIEKFRIDCEIKELQAEQLLTSENSPPILNLPVSDQEINLRERQFEIATKLDEAAIAAQEAQLASLNRVWSARRDRVDAEILLVQAIAQQRIQNN